MNKRGLILVGIVIAMSGLYACGVSSKLGNETTKVATVATLTATETTQVVTQVATKAKRNLAYRAAYATLLKAYPQKSGDSRFALVYIDDDDIPELFIADASSNANGVKMYNYYNGSVTLLSFGGYTEFGQAGRVDYYEKENEIVMSSTGMGGESYDYYEINNGNLTLKTSLKIIKKDIAPGKTSSTYKIDSSEVTYEQLAAKRTEIENGRTYLSADYDCGMVKINKDNIAALLGSN